MLSESFRFSNPDPLFSMASEFLTHLLLYHFCWLRCRKGSLHDCHMRSRLITLQLHTFDLQITLRHTLYIQPHLFQYNRFSLNQHSLFHFLPNLPFILHRNPNLNLSTFCTDLPLESGHRTGLFANQVAATLLAKIGSFAHCGDSSGFNIVFVPCSRFPLLLLRLTYSHQSQGSIVGKRRSLFMGQTYSRRSQGSIATERRFLCSFRRPRKCFSTPPLNQVIDIFTKSVSQPLFEFFRSKLHVRLNQTLSLRWGVKYIQ